LDGNLHPPRHAVGVEAIGDPGIMATDAQRPEQLSPSHTPEEPFRCPTPVASPHSLSHPTASFQASRRLSSSDPSQKGAGSLSTARAWTVRPSPEGGDQRMWSALG